MERNVSLDISTSSQVSTFDDVVLEIYYGSQTANLEHAVWLPIPLGHEAL